MNYDRPHQLETKLYEFDRADPLLSAWVKEYSKLFILPEDELPRLEFLLKVNKLIFDLARQEVRKGMIQLSHNHRGQPFKTTRHCVIAGLATICDQVKEMRTLISELPELKTADIDIQENLYNHNDLFDLLSGSASNVKAKPMPRKWRDLIFNHARDKRKKELKAKGIDVSPPKRIMDFDPPEMPIPALTQMQEKEPPPITDEDLPF
jgi:hypothetical protein